MSSSSFEEKNNKNIGFCDIRLCIKHIRKLRNIFWTKTAKLVSPGLARETQTSRVVPKILYL